MAEDTNKPVETNGEPNQALQKNVVKDTEYGKIFPTSITQEMEKSYLDYAMSVIVARALPDVRDGLKPVHRRILFAMRDMGLTSKAAYKKSARIVGEVLGKYHPHGDQAVYQTLVRLAQDFSMRYPLVDGQGNFGSVDGDSAAAMRYTEAKLAKIADELLEDLDKETVDFVDNFDGSQQEPSVLPAKLPNLLLIGSEGIAVGMATKIPPHNLEEVVDAIKTLVAKSQTTPTQADPKTIETTEPDQLTGGFVSEVTIEELMGHIKGPDFPTGANIYNPKDIREVYLSGKGRILMRATTDITEVKDKSRIVITEIPYLVNKAKLIMKIAQLVKDKKIIGISDIRDESDRKGMHVVIELKKGSRPKSVLNNLFKHTELQTSFPANMVALVDGTPQLCNLKMMLTEYIKHRQLVVVRRSQYELRAAKLRAHILEGLKIALDNLDAVIKTIRESKDSDTARANLMSRFGLTQIQSEAILDMQLRRLSALERQKIEDEYKAIKETIDKLTLLLQNPKQILEVIIAELDGLKEKYKSPRRTKIHGALTTISEEDLVPNAPILITVTKSGYVKRIPRDTFRSQRRGGKGVSSMATKAEDEMAFLLTANNHDDVLFFTNKGKVFHLKAYDLPEGSRQSKGQAVVNLINIDSGETVKSIIAIPDLTKTGGFLVMATKQGLIKKTTLDKYVKIKVNGLTSIKLDQGDQLISVKTTSGDDQVFIVTHRGKAIRFNEKDVRPMGRATKGVKGINIKPDDYVVTMETFPSKENRPDDGRKKYFRDLMVVTERGIGKRTPVHLFPLHKRAGVGVKVAKLNAKTGNIVSAELVTPEISQLMITTKKAQMIKLPLRNIKQLGRNTQGIILMRFNKEGDSVAAMTCIGEEESEE
ncbi:DNA gyrase subunit A [Candidatus Beckwithbacteria bacterium]|nr:DNA gyrase subunit A [Candidatus Beckwithbacteria bacterium]